MDARIWTTGALLLLALFSRVLVRLIAPLFAKQIGEKALSRQPSTIRLVPATFGAWRDRARQERVASALIGAGFKDAGSFTVAEMPGVVVRLFANETDALAGAIYEHPIAGSWYDIYCRYPDGTSATFSTCPPTGLDPRPGCVRVNTPGVAPPDLLRRALAERPNRAPRPVTVTRIAQDFADAYAEDLAWRKQRGIQANEVAKIAAKRAA